MAVFGYGWSNNSGQHSDQQRRLLEHAGYELAHWFADDCAGEKRPASQRFQFQRLLGRIGKHDRLVVCTLDCLGQDARDIVSQIRTLVLCRSELVVLQLGTFDLAGAAGQAVLAALSAVADMERSPLPDPACMAPIAPTPQARTRGRPVCTTQAQRALIIQQHRAGESISALARAANLSRASIMRIVRATSLQ
ncbi:recombinase family protein [Massilia sp. Mn16-1_5]|uniref:recombinase family protein n=1 Tax=Massilia sp. Mn16-1_5 TaxID=2079199 RepID=UPI00109E9BD3|nr:recombinase family protein [Massilia sp. Mn16-1_5]THC46526.1 resolvase [Massilia sp. Mn16-1_5]